MVYLDNLSVMLRKARLSSWIFYLGKLAPRAVVVQMIGGLGNQMFQYAAGRHLSASLGLRLFLDVSWLSTPYARIKKRPPFHLEKYNIKGRVLSPDTIIGSTDAGDTDSFIKDRIGNVKVLSEQESDLTDIAGVNDVLYLTGFWQSEAYFSGSADRIKEELRPRDLSGIAKLERDILATDSVGMHVRRGDYLANQDRFPVLPPSYYDAAIQRLGDNYKFYIFSDDPEWCRSHWHDKGYEIIKGNSPVEDLYLMSLCRNIVIANSSFSWWAAWLDDDGNKRIIAPEDWRGPGYEAMRKGHEALPRHWEKMKYY